MRLNILDSTRGIFAVMVVFLHMTNQSHILYFRFIRNSDIFVEFFFVLSGFVIALSADGRVGDVRTAAAFLIRRIGRIAPLNIAMLTAFVFMILVKSAARHSGVFSAAENYKSSEIIPFIIENALLVQNFRNETVVWLNFPSWSISAELWAYVLFAVFCIAPQRYFPWLAAVALSLSFLVLQQVFDPGFGHFTDMGLYRGICHFFVGYFAYLVWKRVEKKHLPAASFVEIALVISIILTTILSDIYAVNTFAPLIFAIAIIVFSFQSGFISRILRGRFFRDLGDWSYSIYMVHAFVLSVSGVIVRVLERELHASFYSPSGIDSVKAMLIDFGNPYAMDIFSVFLVVVVILISRVTYRFIELPGRAYFKTLSNRLLIFWQKQQTSVLGFR